VQPATVNQPDAAPRPGTGAKELYRHAVRVYWEDTDAGGIVFYANYLKFFERARTEWLRALGVDQHQLREQTRAIFVVTYTAVHYRAPARLDDWLSISVQLQHAGRVALSLAQQAYRGDTLVAEGEVRIACVDSGTLKPMRVPTMVMQALG
jgi:acyl-CoA thioester hydrolase